MPSLLTRPGILIMDKGAMVVVAVGARHRVCTRSPTGWACRTSVADSAQFADEDHRAMITYPLTVSDCPGM